MTTPLPALLISIPKDVLDLSWGHPSPRLHALEAMQRAATAQQAVTRLAQALNQYHAQQR